jgi:acetyl esterase/lipase
MKSSRTSLRPLGAGLLLCLTACAALAAENPAKKESPLPKVPDTVVLERDVEYGKAGDQHLFLDVVRPKKASDRPRPVVVFIHGGGWGGGDKRDTLGTLLVAADRHDYIGFAVNYRLSGEAPWPAQINDCKTAIRWIKSQAATYHLDPEKVAVWGHSAGGHLVALLGTTGKIGAFDGTNGLRDVSLRVTCVVDWAGPTDFLNWPADGMSTNRNSGLCKMLGGTLREARDVACVASPVTHVSSDAAPFLIMHGTQDMLVPITQAETLATALEKANVPVTFVRLAGGGHSIIGAEANNRVYAFLDKCLCGRDVTVSSETIIAPPEPKQK